MPKVDWYLRYPTPPILDPLGRLTNRQTDTHTYVSTYGHDWQKRRREPCSGQILYNISFDASRPPAPRLKEFLVREINEIIEKHHLNYGVSLWPWREKRGLTKHLKESQNPLIGEFYVIQKLGATDVEAQESRNVRSGKGGPGQLDGNWVSVLFLDIFSFYNVWRPTM